MSNSISSDSSAISAAAVSDGFPDEAALRRAVELLFFSYRDFIADPDAILATYGFGRAHHRAVYFVGRAPGITVSDLLTTLKITKQSLARVLNQLVRDGFIVQRTDDADARRRQLYLTNKGTELEAKLSGVQFDRIRAAYAAAAETLGLSESQIAETFAAVLKAMLDEEGRERF